MRRFAELVDRLIYTRSRNAKLAAIAEYLVSTKDPDRGWALAALTDRLDFPAVKPAMIRNLAATQVDPVLFKLSRHHVGDTAETVAMIWPDRGAAQTDPPLTEVVSKLASVNRATAPAVLRDLLDGMDSNGRFAMLKLATGGMRVGISARLAKVAFAQAFSVAIDEVEEYWHAVNPPFVELFDWAAGDAAPPNLRETPYFRPFMLAQPLDADTVDLEQYAAEWKWDGIRIQLCRTHGQTRIYSRGGEEISSAFPEIAEAFNRDGVVDGELLVRGDAQGGHAASFNALQKRLGRRTVTPAMLKESPAFVRLYDVLTVGSADVRDQSWTDRRAALEAFVAHLPPEYFDLSALIPVTTFEELAALRDTARDAEIEGVMLKRRDSPYQTGRRSGHWIKWKRDPLVADCVMMYAQRGNGRRASFFSDYTFGCWTQDGELLPVGKAYSGFTDEELERLDQFVRKNTINRFGPVREVEKTLVLEVAFDSIHLSKRHKSGLAMRFPRISRIRADKPAEEADHLSALMKLATT